MQNFISIRRRGWSRRIPSLTLLGFCLILSFLVSSSRAQVAPVDRFSRSIRHMTSFCPRMCLLGASLICLPIGGQIPQNPNFGGLNRRFPAKLLKSINMHIIKTTASIPTKFCTVIKTNKCPTWVSKHTHHKSEMADGRHLGKVKKSPYISNGFPD